ncbi:MAG TPA: hypothetical protein VN317_07210 [Candidatus Methanoperedens sp.]|nr:hypothetical protein [Candidatus Methanoperedens sp.]
MDAARALAPLVGIIVDMVVQVLALRVAHVGFYLSVLAGFVAGVVAVGALLLGAAAPLAPADALGAALLALGGYAGLGFGYFIFLNLGRTSLSIRLVRELAAAPGQELPLAALLERYGSGHVLDARLERMVAGGQLIRRGERWLSGPRADFLQLARLLDVLKLLLLGRRSFFPSP